MLVHEVLSRNLRDNSVMTARGFDTDRSFTLVEIVEDHMFFETISRLGQIVDRLLLLLVQGARHVDRQRPSLRHRLVAA